jgi:hypothetical protein
MSAFSGRHREERSGFLLNILAATVRALRSFLVVFVQGQNNFEGLMTIEANVIINGHGDLPWECLEQIVRSQNFGDYRFFIGEYKPDRAASADHEKPRSTNS